MKYPLDNENKKKKNWIIYYEPIRPIEINTPIRYLLIYSIFIPHIVICLIYIY